jgi:hypothetical protein
VPSRIPMVATALSLTHPGVAHSRRAQRGRAWAHERAASLAKRSIEKASNLWAIDLRDASWVAGRRSIARFHASGESINELDWVIGTRGLAPVSRFQFQSPYCPSEESLAELALLMAVSKAGNSCDTVNRV